MVKPQNPEKFNAFVAARWTKHYSRRQIEIQHVAQAQSMSSQMRPAASRARNWIWFLANYLT
jgi:hypothetical protein